MALTLMEAAKIAMGKNKEYEASIIELFARGSDLLAALPFNNIIGDSKVITLEETLPEVGFRSVNQGYDESTGDTDSKTEKLFICGGDLDVDIFILDTHGLDERTIQEAMKVKALSLAITKTMVKGYNAANPKEFDGLQARITNDQLIDAGGTAGGDPLSLEKLDELIDAVENPTHLVMNKQMRRRLTTSRRTPDVAGYVTFGEDAFGRRITKYNDIPILIADKDNYNLPIMPFQEQCPGGGASTGTSIYCLAMGDQGVQGLQGRNGISVRDLGELETKPVMRTRVDWYMTLCIKDPNTAARLWGISDAPVVK